MSFFDWVAAILIAWAASAMIIGYVINRKERGSND